MSIATSIPHQPAGSATYPAAQPGPRCDHRGDGLDVAFARARLAKGLGSPL
jgi:hypothetical protein